MILFTKDLILFWGQMCTWWETEEGAGIIVLTTMLLSCFSYAWGIHGIFTGYSWGIHMYRLCIGYVSVMYRLCVGYASEEKSSKGVRKDR